MREQDVLFAFAAIEIYIREQRERERVMKKAPASLFNK